MENIEPKKKNGAFTKGRVVMIYVVLVFLCACMSILGFTIYQIYTEQAEQNSQLVTALNIQMKTNIDNYLDKLEDAGKMVFSHADYIEYDASKTLTDKYTALKLENELSDYLISISTMDNYCDFGIVYSNNHTVGRITNGTNDLFSNKLYSVLETSLDGRKTCWTTGFDGNFKRIYYLRRVNENAIMTASFYCDELSKVFTDKSQLGNVKIMLCDADKHIIYSSDENVSGQLDTQYTQDWDENADFTVVSMPFIESVNSCAEDWYVISVMDLTDLNFIYKKIATVSIVIMGVGIVIILIAYMYFKGRSDDDGKKSVYQYAKMQTVDGLTGLPNAETAENLIAEKIETCITGSTIMLALVSIKNYKLIEENYKTAGVNEAVLTVSQLLQDIYGEKNIVGKTSDNEFEIFADFTEYDLFKAHDRLKNSLKSLDERLKDCQLSSDRGYIKCCVGAAVYPDCSSDYDDLYDCAKKSLEESLESDSGKFVLHKTEKHSKKGVKV